MSGSRKHVKLYLYRFDSEDIEIFSHRARSWGDFIVLKLDAPVTDGQYEHIVREMRAALEGAGTNKEIVVIPSSWDISFYGVEVDEKKELERA